MSQVNTKHNIQNVAERLSAAFAKKPIAPTTEIVRASTQAGKPFNECPVSELLLPDGIEQDTRSNEQARLDNHHNNRQAKSDSDRDHGDKTYEAARAQCAPKK